MSTCPICFTSVSIRNLTANLDLSISRLVRGGEARATALLTAKINELHLVRGYFMGALSGLLTIVFLSVQLARALVDHETLNLEEVKKVIKGEPIKNITEVLEEDISNVESASA